MIEAWRVGVSIVLTSNADQMLGALAGRLFGPGKEAEKLGRRTPGLDDSAPSCVTFRRRPIRADGTARPQERPNSPSPKTWSEPMPKATRRITRISSRKEASDHPECGGIPRPPLPACLLPMPAEGADKALIEDWTRAAAVFDMFGGRPSERELVRAFMSVIAIGMLDSRVRTKEGIKAKTLLFRAALCSEIWPKQSAELLLDLALSLAEDILRVEHAA